MAEAVTVSTKTPNKDLPPIGVLFSESWELLKLSWKKLLLFTLVMAGIVVVFVIVLGIILAVSFGGGIYALSHGGISPASIGALGIGAIAGIVLLVAGAIILGSLSQAGWILSVNDPKLSIEQILRRSFHFVLPLFALSFLTFLLALPAFFLLIIPGLFVVFFLYFGPYAMLLGNRGVLDSLRRSIYLIKTNFGAMFLRMLLMIGVYIAVSVVFGLVSFSVIKVPVLGILFAILRNVVNIALAWFLISYSLTLYKQAEAASPDKEGKGKLLWFVLLAIASLIFASLLIGVIAKSILSSPAVKDAILNSAAKSSSSGSLNSGDVLKQTYKNAFVQSCEQGNTQNTKLCTCIADNLVNKYSTSQLQDIIKKYAATKVVPQELTNAAKACMPATTQ